MPRCVRRVPTEQAPVNDPLVSEWEWKTELAGVKSPEYRYNPYRAGHGPACAAHLAAIFALFHDTLVGRIRF